MIGALQVKVCGLTRTSDALHAAEIGADHLGFILYPKSPRYLPLAEYIRMRAGLPELPHVAVMVSPSHAELEAALRAGFSFLQIHFPVTEAAGLRSAVELAGPQRLWLAPKLPPTMDVETDWLPLADTWLLDTYRPDSFGGTGHTGDWPKFRRHREAYPGKRWVLAGGLAPENVAAAVAASGAAAIDINSGVEQAPGLKDTAKLAALRAALCGGCGHRTAGKQD
jgi:phosphoribosylanthranilate isomerase